MSTKRGATPERLLSDLDLTHASTSRPSAMIEYRSAQALVAAMTPLSLFTPQIYELCWRHVATTRA